MKELKMTVICKTCENQFGAWRSRCPACGTVAPPAPRLAMLESKKPKRERKPKRKRNECILCHNGGAKKLRCPHCNEQIHKGCLELHRSDCLKFQLEREAIINATAQEAVKAGRQDLADRITGNKP